MCHLPTNNDSDALSLALILIVSAVILRRAVRALLCSPADEVLLIKHWDSTSGDVFWVTPGGGLEAGEDVATCLRRELFEETGLVVSKIGPPVWRRVNEFAWQGGQYKQEETFYLIRHPRFTPLADNATATERNAFAGFGWWTVESLRTSTETFSPSNLASILRKVLRGSTDRGP